jgi:hypothetical protein
MSKKSKRERLAVLWPEHTAEAGGGRQQIITDGDTSAACLAALIQSERSVADKLLESTTTSRDCLRLSTMA